MPSPEKPAPRRKLRQPIAVSRIPSQAARPHFLGYARNVSETGMFLQCPLPPPPGTHLTVRMTLPDGGSVVVARGAKVVWVREYKGWRASPPGMGLHLSPAMGEDEKKIWKDFCKSQS